MEVILYDSLAITSEPGILHVCGGDPNSVSLNSKWHMVFSTYVEVILTLPSLLKLARCILHVCGGDPQRQPFQRLNQIVFSTYVEVILDMAKQLCLMSRILHVCGGDP